MLIPYSQSWANAVKELPNIDDTIENISIDLTNINDELDNVDERIESLENPEWVLCPKTQLFELYNSSTHKFTKDIKIVFETRTSNENIGTTLHFFKGDYNISANLSGVNVSSTTTLNLTTYRILNVFENSDQSLMVTVKLNIDSSGTTFSRSTRYLTKQDESTTTEHINVYYKN